MDSYVHYHLRNVDKEDYALIKEHNIAVSSNMNWHCFTHEESSALEKILAKPYYKQAYPMKSFFDKDILVSQCTDTLTDNGINYPFYCMQVAVTGTYEPGMDAWQPEELIDRYQFLQAMTYNGAWQLHLEKDRGSIEAGKYADHRHPIVIPDLIRDLIHPLIFLYRWSSRIRQNAGKGIRSQN